MNCNLPGFSEVRHTTFVITASLNPAIRHLYTLALALPTRILPAGRRWRFLEMAAMIWMKAGFCAFASKGQRVLEPKFVPRMPKPDFPDERLRYINV